MVCPNVFRAVGANTKKRTLALLEQWQPSNVVTRPPKIFKELKNFHDQTKNAENYLDNSEMLGLTSARIGGTTGKIFRRNWLF